MKDIIMLTHRRIVLRALLTSLVLLAAFSVRANAQTETIEYYHLDALGSVRAVTNQAGAVIERHDYLPFGEEVNPPSGAQPVQFTGQERDAETGMDYFGARYYSGKRARFTTVDPDLGIQTALVDPQRWNRYAYVGNRPTKVVDPDGRGWIAVAAKLARAAWTGQDYYSAVSTVAEGTATVFSGDARVGTTDRLWATGSVLLELSSVTDIVKGTKAIVNAVDDFGTIYKVPGKATNSGKPYIGRHNKPNPAKTRRSKDGRDRSQAEVVDTYDPSNTLEGRVKEQQQIDSHGLGNLDNRRNEIKKQ